MPITIEPEYTPEYARASAARGATWMDAHCDGWRSLIDASALDMSDGSVCIMGQTGSCITRGHVGVLGAYTFSNVLWWLEEQGVIPKTRLGWAAEHGFCIPFSHFTFHEDAEEAARWEMLKLAWLEILSVEVVSGL